MENDYKHLLTCRKNGDQSNSVLAVQSHRVADWGFTHVGRTREIEGSAMQGAPG